MSGSVNKVILIGRLGRLPEPRQTKDGRNVCSFSMATSQKSNGKEKTEWHNIVVWDKLAQIATQYLQKGSFIYLEGRLQTSSWDDGQGNKRYKTEVVGYTMQMLGGKEPYQAPEQSQPTRQPEMKFEQDPFSRNQTTKQNDNYLTENDDLPF